MPITAASAGGGNTLHIRGNGLSFSIREPEGWTIDFRSAAQIAHFVAHPQGATWRDARVVAFGRFVRRQSDSNLDTFFDRDLRQFQERCPFYEIEDPKLEIDGKHRFLSRKLHCPGVRHEIIAVTDTPRFFVTFILSSGSEDRLESGLAAFQELLSSFEWVNEETSGR